MPTESLSETIKVRLLPDMKEELEEQAKDEQLDVSDIVRRALREFLGRSRRRKPSPAHR